MIKKILVGSITVLLATTGAAQTEPEVQLLPDTVVKANRVPVPSEQVGSAVTVITAEEMEERQVRLVSEVLRDVPGLAVSRNGPVGQITQVRIRGAEGNHTQVIIDGVEANNPGADDEFNFAHLLAEDIERIEVIRGPQSALWGSEAVGGVINIVTKKGKKGLRGSGYLEAGSFNTVDGNVALSGGGESYRYSAAGTFLSTDGVNMSRFGTEEDGYRNATLNLTGSVEPGQTLELSGNARFINTKVESDPQDFTTGSPTDGFTIDGDNERTTQEIYARAQAKLALFEGAWQNTVGGNLTSVDGKNNADGIFSSGTDANRTRFDFQSSVFFSTPQLAEADHTAIFYFEHSRENFENTFPDPLSMANQKQSTFVNSVAGEYRLGLWQSTFLSGSLRYDDNDLFDPATTFRFTGAQLFADIGSRLHGSVGNGVKNPGFFDLFGFTPAFFIGNPDLRPEKSEGWDIGWEQTLLGGSLVFDLTYFQANLEDEIVAVFLPTFVSTVINQDGESKRRGIEVEVKGRIRRNTDVALAYTYMNSEDPDGLDEIRRPNHIASLVINHRFAAGKGNVNLNIRYNGPMDDLQFTSVGSNRVKLDGYTLVGLGASYQLTRNVQLFGRIENLLDQSYEEVFSNQTPGIGAFAGVRMSGDLL
jgi:vitamin B12 transporter